MRARSWPSSTQLSAAAVALCAASAATWLAALLGSTASGLAQAGMLALATLVGVAGAIWLGKSRVAEQRLVARFLTDLAETSADGSTGGPAAIDLPSALAKSPWKASLEAAAAALRACHQRAEEAELARTALEIRVRRATEAQERTQQILTHLSEPVLVVDQYDELVMANDSATRVLHLTESNSAHGAIARLIKCEKLVDLLTETRRRPVATTRTEEVELRDAGDKPPRWFSVTASNMALNTEGGDAQTGSSGAVAVLRDITGQKAAQQRNAEFVSSVSHEMKTPLAGIKAYVELLADGDAEDEETREEFLHVINSQADRLQRLIDNMLNLARIEAGVVKVDRQHRPLNELLEEAANVVQPAAEKKRIALTTDLSGMYLGVLADRDMLLQAAINLLSNAIKYTPDGGRVTLRSRMSDGEVQFEVEDTGVGLSPEDCRRVFDKFYRVKKDSEMAPGTGLGLALVKHIVEDVHNGRVELTSELGRGSTFVVTLPGAARMG